jgi:hypothetical protein
MKQAFFLRMMELAIEKGRDWNMIRQIEQEIEDRFGGS